MKKFITSPSRTYVAICNKINFDGFYCRKFELPEEIKWGEGVICFDNTTERASWYFLNVLDGYACVEMVIPFEDYSDLNDVTDTNNIVCTLIKQEIQEIPLSV